MKASIEVGYRLEQAPPSTSLGFIPDRVQVYNITDGTIYTEAFLSRWNIPFASGGSNSNVISAGDKILGATSGATAIVESVLIQSGSFAAGTAAGFLIVPEGRPHRHLPVGERLDPVRRHRRHDHRCHRHRQCRAQPQDGHRRGTGDRQQRAVAPRGHRRHVRRWLHHRLGRRNGEQASLLGSRAAHRISAGPFDLWKRIRKGLKCSVLQNASSTPWKHGPAIRAPSTSSRIDATENRLIPAGSTLSLVEKLHESKTILLDTLAGSTVTLPASTGNGAKYRFCISIVPTSNSHIIKVQNSTDVMSGVIVEGTVTTAAALAWQTAASSDTITLNRTTTGGTIKGEWIEVEDIAAGFWAVRGSSPTPAPA
jgi:hypothetical protein